MNLEELERLAREAPDNGSLLISIREARLLIAVCKAAQAWHHTETADPVATLTADLKLHEALLALSGATPSP